MRPAFNARPSRAGRNEILAAPARAPMTCRRTPSSATFPLAAATFSCPVRMPTSTGIATWTSTWAPHCRRAFTAPTVRRFTGEGHRRHRAVHRPAFLFFCRNGRTVRKRVGANGAMLYRNRTIAGGGAGQGCCRFRRVSFARLLCRGGCCVEGTGSFRCSRFVRVQAPGQREQSPSPKKRQQQHRAQPPSTQGKTDQPGRGERVAASGCVASGETALRKRTVCRNPVRKNAPEQTRSDPQERSSL